MIFEVFRSIVLIFLLNMKPVVQVDSEKIKLKKMKIQVLQVTHMTNYSESRRREKKPPTQSLP